MDEFTCCMHDSSCDPQKVTSSALNDINQLSLSQIPQSWTAERKLEIEGK